MTRRARLGALAICPLALPLGGCAGSAAGADPVDFASQAVPSVVVPPSGTSPSTAPTLDETQAVLDAYTEYVTESDRFFDESIAAAAEAGLYAGSPELDAILDAVAIAPIREFDLQTPQALWEKGGVATVGAPAIVTATVVNVDPSTDKAQLDSCTDVSSVDYVDVDGKTLKSPETPAFLREEITLSETSNPRNHDITRWYVMDRTSEQVEAC